MAEKDAGEQRTELNKFVTRHINRYIFYVLSKEFVGWLKLKDFRIISALPKAASEVACSLSLITSWVGISRQIFSRD